MVLDSTSRHAKRIQREQDIAWATCLREHHAFLENHAKHLHPSYLEGLAALELSPFRLPTLRDLNRRLILAGWEGVPVRGFIPARQSFRLQADRKVPLGGNLRALADAAYSPQPDLLHDLLGHAPFSFSHEITELTIRIGAAAARAPLTASEKEKYAGELELSTLKAQRSRDATQLLGAEERVSMNKQRSMERAGIFDQLQRLYLWSIEFGLVRIDGEIKVLGAGLLSSRAELQRLLAGKTPIYPFDERVLTHEIHFTNYQEQLFVIEDFAQVYALLDRIGAS